MSSEWFDAAILEGTQVRLEGLSQKHVDDLWQSSQDDDVWQWMPVARPRTVQDMQAVVDGALAEHRRGTRVPWAIVERGSGRAVGSSSYLDVVPEHLRVEIGWTWLGRPWWRTAINTEAKLLLLQRAFDGLGARRVALKTDAENARSQDAIERLGAAREGALRDHMARPDGSARTTVYFSLLRSEWPHSRQRLTHRLRDNPGGASSD